MSASYFFESVQPLGDNPPWHPGGFRYSEQQRVHLRTSAGWGYPMGVVAKTPGGLWVHTAPIGSKAYSTRELAAASLHDWFEANGFASRPQHGDQA